MSMALAPVVALESLPAEARDAKIMARCDLAIGHLREARSIEGVMAIRNAADAFAHYARKMKAAVEAKNECELVVMLAEARIGAELKAAQERGEVATRGDSLRVGPEVPERNIGKATLPEIGLTRKQAMEAKRLAAAGEPAIRAEVRRATEEGRRPSRRNLIASIPAIAERPPECTRFVLWLRTGAQFLPTLGDPAAFLTTLRAHRMEPPSSEAETVISFLAGMSEGNQ
jgi:hypothetical protein